MARRGIDAGSGGHACGVGLLVVAALFAATPADAFETPDCAGLAAWAAALDGRETVPVNEALSIPAAFADDVTAAAFGTAFIAWTGDEAEALESALNDCRRAARGDKAAEAAFSAWRKAASGAARTLRDIAKAREAAAGALAALDAGPKPPELATALNALAATEEPGLKKFSSNYRDVSRLARAMSGLPSAEIAELRAAAVERATALTGGISDAGLAAIEAASDTPSGILAVRQAAFDARRDAGAAAAPVAAAAEAREADIRAALQARAPAPALPPTCDALIGWVSGIDAGATRRTRQGAVLTAFEDPNLEALFGVSFQRWTQDDLDLFGATAAQCRAAAGDGLLGGDARAVERAARTVERLHAQGAEQSARVAALAAARAEADRLVTETAAAAARPDGLAALEALAAAVRSARIEPEDADRVAAAIAGARDAAVASTLAPARAAMAAAAPTLEGLAAVRAAAEAVLAGPDGRRLSPDERAGFVSETEAALAALAPAALPDFESSLAALPANEDGLRALEALARRTVPETGAAWDGWRIAVAARRGAIAGAIAVARLPELEADLAAAKATLEDLGRVLVVKLESDRRKATQSDAYAAWSALAGDKAKALREELARVRCAEFAPSVSEAERPVFVGADVAPLGDFLCGVARATGSPPEYDGPGMFGSDHRVRFMAPGGYQMTAVLREVQIRPGVEALVGVEIEDPTSTRAIGVDEWTTVSADLSGLRGPGACDAIARALPSRLAAADMQAAIALGDCLVSQPAAPIPSW
jgi:hypothetical protein